MARPPITARNGILFRRQLDDTLDYLEDNLGGGGGSSDWGDIGGTLADQTDLQGALDTKAATSSLATVATSGAYADLSGAPSLATVATTGSYGDLSGIPGTFTPAAHTHTEADITDLGSYLPLSGGTVTGTLHANGNIELTNTNPLVQFVDSDQAADAQKIRISAQDDLLIVTRHNDDNTQRDLSARFDESGTTSSNAVTIITREKGDARYQPLDTVLTNTTASFTTADETKLDGIETGATADQTGAEIKAAYEAEANTNAFTDAEKTKLSGIATGAEVNTVDSVNTQTGAVVLDADDISDAATTNKFTTAADISKLAGIESNATADQTDAEIETAYNNQVSVVSQAEAEAGTATTVRRWTAQRIKQAIDALGGGGGGGTTITLFQVEGDGSTTQTTTTGLVDLAGIWASPSLTDSDFSWNGTTGTLTVNTTGTVELDVSVMAHQTTGNNRTMFQVALEKNGSTVLASTYNYSHRNNTSQDRGGAVITGFKDAATATDTYRVQVKHFGTAVLINDANVPTGTWLSAKLYK